MPVRPRYYTPALRGLGTNWVDRRRKREAASQYLAQKPNWVLASDTSKPARLFVAWKGLQQSKARDDTCLRVQILGMFLHKLLYNKDRFIGCNAIWKTGRWYVFLLSCLRVHHTFRETTYPVSAYRLALRIPGSAKFIKLVGGELCFSWRYKHKESQRDRHYKK